MGLLCHLCLAGTPPCQPHSGLNTCHPHFTFSPSLKAYVFVCFLVTKVLAFLNFSVEDVVVGIYIYIFNATPEAPVVAAVFAANPGAAGTAVYYMEVHRDSSELGRASLMRDNCNREKSFWELSL